jgi:beta-glucanase (GH16 family)
MKRYLLLASLMLVSVPAWGAEWKLVWADEFNEPGLPNPARWDYETGFIRNNEQQYYTRERKENARVEDGVLIIEARKEKLRNPAYDPNAKGAGRGRRNREFADYTSASLTTRGKASWTYGRIEVRAKLPAGRGTWPAIWMLGTNSRQVGWPACGEIDIMEFVGFEPGIIHANIHTKKYNHVLGTGKGDKITIPDASEAFHVYAVEWEPDRLDFFVDNQKYFTFRNEGTGADVWPYDKDQYLILNLAIGGAWGGQKGIDDSIFPQRYCIDYVRVYARDQKATSEGGVQINKTEEGYQFCEAEKPVLFYRTVAKAAADGKYSRANYCHPVYGLDGRVLTEDFPQDHPHHRGVFWGWHQMYVGDTALGDMWACEDFTWDVHTVQILPPPQNAAALRGGVYWKSSRWKEGREPFAQETVTIRVHPVANDIRLIDFDIEILALTEGLRLGGSNDAKGYGGFSTRIVLSADLRMSDASGPVTPQETAVTAGDWMNFAGTFGAAPSNFAILVHPSNPGHPRQWILRASGSAQNVAYPGRAPIPLSTTKPLALRYRLVLHKNADLNQLFRQYSQMKEGGLS